MTQQTHSEDCLEEVEARIAELIGMINCAYGKLVQLIAQVKDGELWSGPGIRSVEHWLTWQAGVSRGTAAQLNKVAIALESHPQTTSLLVDGRLTLDQTAAAVTAHPDHDAEIAVLAPAAMVSQLRTLARCSRPPKEPTSDEPSSMIEQLHFSRGDDGWLHGSFRLAPDHAQTFLQAVDEARDRMFADGATQLSWTDVLIDVCERSIASQSPERIARYRTYVFVDPAQPVPASWPDGVTVSGSLLRLFTCDGMIQPVIVNNGVPVSVGRTQRTVPGRTRRLVTHRDHGTCQSPWCNSTRGLDVHHIIHWEYDGPTDTWNLILLCRRCHRALHRGEFSIVGNADRPETLRFINDRGIDIVRPQPAPDPVPTWKRLPHQRFQRPLGEPMTTHWLGFAPPSRAG